MTILFKKKLASEILSLALVMVLKTVVLRLYVIIIFDSF